MGDEVRSKFQYNQYNYVCFSYCFIFLSLLVLLLLLLWFLCLRAKKKQFLPFYCRHSACHHNLSLIFGRAINSLRSATTDSRCNPPSIVFIFPCTHWCSFSFTTDGDEYGSKSISFVFTTFLLLLLFIVVIVVVFHALFICSCVNIAFFLSVLHTVQLHCIKLWWKNNNEIKIKRNKQHQWHQMAYSILDFNMKNSTHSHHT